MADDDKDKSKKQEKPITTDKQIEALKPKDKDYTKKIGDGLFILVKTDGSKHWRYRFTVNGNRGTLSFHTYPEVELLLAKEQSIANNKLVAAGIDPREKRKADELEVERNKLTFKELADEWITDRELSKRDTFEDKRRLKADVFPKIGSMPIVTLDSYQLDKLVFKPLKDRGVIPSAIRIRTILRGVFKLAKSRNLISENPAADIILPAPLEGHHAALTNPADVIPMLRSMWAYCERGTPTVSNALILSVSIFLRPVEIRTLKWENINADDDVIEIVYVKQLHAKSKKNTLIIPMSRQVRAILDEQRRFAGNSPYIFPAQQQGRKNPYISSAAIRNALINIGYGGLQTPHGFRATAATILGERLKRNKDHIEMQLSHTVKDSNNGAYHRGQWLDDRREMMQAWSDCLDDMKDGKLIGLS